MAERFFQLFGERLDLLELRKEAGGITIHGYVAALGDHGPVRGSQNVFVNRRIVRDRTIAHAISEAYSVATIKERSPEVHLFIEIPPDRVDVNVHPDQSGGALPRAVAGARGAAPGARRHAWTGAGAGTAALAVAGRPGEPQPMTIPGVLAGATIGSRWTPAPYPIDRPIPSAAPAVDPSAWQHRPDGSRWSQPQAGEPARCSPARVRIDSGEMTPDTGEIKPMIPLGQFRDTYIVAIDDEGIAIIDQHVAHERVLFELVMEKLTAGRAREPAAAHADRARAVAAAAAGAGAERAPCSSGSGWKSRTSAATA